MCRWKRLRSAGQDPSPSSKTPRGPLRIRPGPHLRTSKAPLQDPSKTRPKHFLAPCSKMPPRSPPVVLQAQDLPSSVHSTRPGRLRELPGFSQDPHHPPSRTSATGLPGCPWDPPRTPEDPSGSTTGLPPDNPGTMTATMSPPPLAVATSTTADKTTVDSRLRAASGVLPKTPRGPPPHQTTPGPSLDPAPGPSKTDILIATFRPFT